MPISCISISDTAEKGGLPDRQRQVDDLHEDEHEHERAGQRDRDDHGPAAIPAGADQRADVEHRVDEEPQRAEQRDVGDRQPDAGREQQRVPSRRHGLALGFRQRAADHVVEQARFLVQRSPQQR